MASLSLGSCTKTDQLPHIYGQQEIWNKGQVVVAFREALEVAPSRLVVAALTARFAQQVERVLDARLRRAVSRREAQGALARDVRRT